MNVSVVIPALNEEQALPACLDAIAAQTRRPYEVLVVDNGSSDATANVAGEYPFVTVLTELQKGRVFARNTGFRAASGDVIARIDADAIVPAHWIEHIASYYADDAHASSAWTGGAHFYNVRFTRFISAVYNWLVFRLNTLLAGHASLWGSNMALPAPLWRLVADDICADNSLHEDLDVSIHLHRHGVNIAYDKQSPVRVKMRRVRSNRDELWAYLAMWPATLSRHGLRTAAICWVVCGLLYISTPLLTVLETAARFAGKKPLAD